jgi:long-chain acyl-CoA synthetase
MAAITLGDIAVSAAATTPDRVALADERRRLTYAELESRSARFASFLRREGLVPGSRVAICLRNQVEFLEAHLGVLRAGCVSVPLPPDSAATELQTYLADCEPAAVVGTAAVFDRDATIARGRLCLTDRSAESFPGPTIDDAIAGSSDSRVAAPATDALAVLLYTTGASGAPKAVMLSHRNTLAAVRNEISVVGISGERELVALPLHHSYGLGQVYCNLATGGTVHLRNGLTRLKSIFDVLREQQITAFACTPTGYQLILQRGAEAFASSASTLRQTVVNSSPLSRELGERLRALLPELRVFVYYGLTEASRATFLCLNDVEATDYESVGQPAPGIGVTVARPDASPAAPGEAGEIMISGETVALGYWRRPDETAASFHASQLRTGDVGMFDERGHLWIRGRLKDIINVGGLKVSPAEVENRLRAHPEVSDCAVGGVADPIAGEAVGALVVLKTGSVVSFDELAAHCGEALEPFKVPRVWAGTNAIPRSDSGKLLRREIESALRDHLAAPRAIH